MKKLSLYLILLCLPGLLLSQNAEDVVAPFIGMAGPGSRADGIGQAYAGIADDFSAIHYNPAGLAHITWAELSLGGTYFSLDNSVTTTKNETVTANTTRNYFHTNSLGYVWPVYGLKFTLGVGYNTVALTDQALRIQWQDSTEFTNEESNLGAYTIAGGYQLQKELSVGIGLHLYRGDNVYSSQMYRVGETNSAYEIDSHYSGVGFTLGILWAPIDFLRTGFSFKSPKYLDVDETLTGTWGDWNGNYQIQSPPEVQLGQSVTLGNFLVAGSVVWKDWSSSEMSADIPGYNGVPIDIEVNHNIQNDFASVLELAAGAEYLLPIMDAKIRGGVHHVPSYRNDDSVGDRLVLSGGVSVILAQQFKVDWSISRASWAEIYNQQESADIINTWSTINFSYRF
ncbi:MAG: outer membrane protein transport protein [Candidatus Marinimicrobia bacterium]|nr:outer membrane protein transport protein [Candidatus Neomarinimicrobiota bacterium]MCF7880212.1 outer membrane protein transport protein [Candidatus Neomarinimicrobiota bacterium]